MISPRPSLKPRVGTYCETRSPSRLRASSFGLSVYFIRRAHCGAVGVLVTHIDDILGRGEPVVFEMHLRFRARRFGAPKSQDAPLTYAGKEVSQAKDPSVTATQKKSAEELQPMSRCAFESK